MLYNCKFVCVGVVSSADSEHPKVCKIFKMTKNVSFIRFKIHICLSLFVII